MADLQEAHIQKILRWSGWGYRTSLPESQFYSPRLLARMRNIPDHVVEEATYLIQQVIDIELKLTDALERLKASSIGGEIQTNHEEIMSLKSERRRLKNEIIEYLDLWGPFDLK